MTGRLTALLLRGPAASRLTDVALLRGNKGIRVLEVGRDYIILAGAAR
jgi:hypothetical protein